MNRPVIGIVAKHLRREMLRPDTYVRDEMKQAIFDNGGIAIGILSPVASAFDGRDIWEGDFSAGDFEDLMTQELGLCDGVIFQGGAAYDGYETLIAKYCYEHDIPTMGICCGQNAIVRALGGTTIMVQNAEKHNQPEAKYVHDIYVLPGSRFYEIVGCVETMRVNSRHERVVATFPGISVAAYDDDGNIEVVEAADKKFFVGMRFHPESLYREDEKMRAIFERFIDTCRRGV